MFICYHCGYVSNDDRINYCNNPKCRNYGCNETRCNMNNAAPRNNMPDMGMNKNNEINPKRSLLKNDSHLAYEFDFNYPSDKMTTMKTGDDVKLMPKNEENAVMPAKMMNNDCGMLAFATVPMQPYEKLYSPDEAIRAGTIFPSLHMPYDKKILWRG